MEQVSPGYWLEDEPGVTCAGAGASRVPAGELDEDAQGMDLAMPGEVGVIDRCGCAVGE